MKIIMKSIKIAFSIFVGLFMLVVVLGIIGAATSEPKAETPTVTPIRKAIAVESPAKELAEDIQIITDHVLSVAYEDNPIAADAQFRGKRVSVVGRIDHIGREILGSPYIVLENDVQCGFSKADEASVATLKKGQKVMITGTVKGLILLNVYLDRCEFTANRDTGNRVRTAKN